MCEVQGFKKKSFYFPAVAIVCISFMLIFAGSAIGGNLSLTVKDNNNGTVHVQVVGHFDTCCTPNCVDTGYVHIRKSGGANYNVCYASGRGSAHCEATVDNCDLGYDSGGKAMFYAMGRDCTGSLPMVTQAYQPDRSINIDIISPSGTVSEPFDVVARVTLPKTSKAYKGYIEARVSSAYGWNLPGMQCTSENCVYSYQALSGSLYDLYHGTNQSVMFGAHGCGLTVYKIGTFSVDKTPAVSIATPEGKVSSPFDITGTATFKPSLNATKGYIIAKINGYTVDTKQCLSESCSYSYWQNRGQPINYPPGGSFTASLVASVSGISVTRFKTFEVVPCNLQTGSVNAGPSTIDLSRGEAVNFAGNVTDGSGRPVNWSLSVAGRTFTGSGNSVVAAWDGRDASGKKVQPGTYTAT
ncbi:MAG TPA: hypothetical protein P5308_09860, partial [Syntrophales bacterium]|nr:hypothetical protein [Syntrophales bacterium]